MQKASNAYKKAIKQAYRNRGYIRATIGLVNQKAQNTAVISNDKNKLSYYSDSKKIFDGNSVSRIYATAEENFSKTDGSMYFLPSEESGLTYYNNGVVSKSIAGSFFVEFSENQSFDIKGLSIDFGDEYPTGFSVEWNNGIQEFQNTQRLFFSENVFENVTWMKITPSTMKNKNTRLRIYGLTFGIAKTFGNETVIGYSFKDYISPISESLPSQDMMLEIDNQDLYYSVDNPESAFSFLETGQEIRVSFGYDIGNDVIEWLPENTGYLKAWKANDKKATFTATDIFDFIGGYYYRGLYRPNGITLYDLAVDVLTDAGVEENNYLLDEYLKTVVVKNPLPPVKHTEALQIIANAGRCILFQDRYKRIFMKSDFIPEMHAATNGQTPYGNVEDILKNTKKEAYAICSNDFSTADGTLLFMPKNAGNIVNTGYVSNSLSDSEGLFDNNPVITITTETIFTAYGLNIKFRNIAPKEFIITTYNQGKQSKRNVVTETHIDWFTEEVFEKFDTMTIEFTKGHPNSRIVIDSILISDVTDYTLERNVDIFESSGERKAKVKNISVERNIYAFTSETLEISNETIKISEAKKTHTLYFSEPYYDFSVSTNSSSVTAKILKSSAYMVVLEFANLSGASVEFTSTVKGKEYAKSKVLETQNYNSYGEEIVWKNPLISESTHAGEVREWIATHLLGDVDYNISWRGDPRVDAGDLVYLELKSRETALTKIYQNSLNFNGAWSCNTKARKAVVTWQ